ncbi:putative FAD/NAD(P)-binding domain superfamily, mnmG domain-containing protein [Helianthus anomalus]
MKKIVESTPNLSIREAMVTDLLLGTNADVKGVHTFFGMNFYSSYVGSYNWHFHTSWRISFSWLIEHFQSLGFETDRLKSGTPARVDSHTVDYSVLEPQHGDEEVFVLNLIR